MYNEIDHRSIPWTNFLGSKGHTQSGAQHLCCQSNPTALNSYLSILPAFDLSRPLAAGSFTTKNKKPKNKKNPRGKKEQKKKKKRESIQVYSIIHTNYRSGSAFCKMNFHHSPQALSQLCQKKQFHWKLERHPISLPVWVFSFSYNPLSWNRKKYHLELKKTSKKSSGRPVLISISFFIFNLRIYLVRFFKRN